MTKTEALEDVIFKAIWDWSLRQERMKNYHDIANEVLRLGKAHGLVFGLDFGIVEPLEVE